MKTAYHVISANPRELAAARAAGNEVLFEGDALGVAQFFRDLTQGLSYGVLAASPPADRERVRAAFLQCEALAARIEATMLAIRVLFPIAPQNRAMLEGEQDYDFEMEVTATLEQCLYSFLPPLRQEMQRMARAEEP